MMTLNPKLKMRSKELDSNFSLLIFLQIFAVVLCFVVPFSLFAPVPIAIALLLYGRLPSLFFSALIAAIVWYLTMRFPTNVGAFLSGVHLVSVFCGVLISEVISRNLNPIKGLMITGFTFVLITAGIIVVNDRVGTVKLKGQITQAVDQFVKELKENNKEQLSKNNEEARIINGLVSNPSQIVDGIYKFVPAIIFVSIFFAIWVALYLTLRMAKVWRYKNLYAFSTRDLISFKTPDFFVYPLIASLVLYVGSDHGFGKDSEVIGLNLLYSLGVFYLFQGFGVFYDFLTFLRIGGVFKTAMLTFVMVTSFKFLALIGIFDLWFDFRKYFIKKNNDEGDML